MKKIGSIEFFENVDLNLKFDFDELVEFHGATENGIKEVLLDENENIKMDVLDELVEVYINMKIKNKYGNDYSLDVMDDTMNISWDIKNVIIKKHHTEKWWDKVKSEPKKLELGKRNLSTEDKK